MYFEIYGYDSNWEMGGSHHNPKLCTVKANSRAQAEEYAKTLKDFWDSWHGRGYITEVKIVDLTEEKQ